MAIVERNSQQLLRLIDVSGIKYGGRPVLGKRKTIIKKNLNEFQENDSEVIFLDQVRDDLEGRIQQATKGWAKLPAIQKKRALRKFFLLRAVELVMGI